MQAGSPVLKYKEILAEAKYRVPLPYLFKALSGPLQFHPIPSVGTLKVTGRHSGELLAMP